LPCLIEQLSELQCEIALTTNGVLLPKWAPALRAAGLDRITVSLDALSPEAFQLACDAPSYGPGDVLLGIRAAQEAGFGEIKINCVVQRGKNEHQILPLMRHFAHQNSAHQNITVRFIEFMDVGTRNGWELSGVVSKAEILEILGRDGAIEPIPARSPGEVASRFSSPHGEFGIIASVTEPFCSDCCRARLSADGSVYTCLFAHQGLSLKKVMRAGATDEELDRAIVELWSKREDRYSQLRKPEPGAKSQVHLPTVGRVEMSYIGG
jgi:cyclic pyranopterin phosphate synthase